MTFIFAILLSLMTPIMNTGGGYTTYSTGETDPDSDPDCECDNTPGPGGDTGQIPPKK